MDRHRDDHAEPARLLVHRTWDGAPAPDADRVTLEVALTATALRLVVDAPFHGDPPPAAPPGPTDRLWEHEVVELFVLGPGERYTEIELGPHGHHLVLQLEGRRNTVATGLPIDFAATLDGARWRGEALVPRALLPPGPHRINAYAIHGLGAGRRYLAMTPVPGAQPDFHRLDRFERAPWAAR